jgi:hypothetical protein
MITVLFFWNFRTQLLLAKVEVEVKVTLRLATNRQSARLGVNPLETHD